MVTSLADRNIDDGRKSGSVAFLCQIDVAGNGRVNSLQTTLLQTLHDGMKIARNFGGYLRMKQEMEVAIRHWEFRRPTDPDYVGPVNMARMDEISSKHPDVGVHNVATSNVTVSTILVVAEIGADRLRFPYEYVGVASCPSMNNPQPQSPSGALRYQRLLRSGEEICIPDTLRSRLLREGTLTGDTLLLRYSLWKVEASISGSGTVSRLRSIPLISDGENVFDSAYSVAMKEVGHIIETEVKQWLFKSFRDPDYDGPIQPKVFHAGGSELLFQLLSKGSGPYTLEFLVYLPLSSRMPDFIEYLPVRLQ